MTERAALTVKELSTLQDGFDRLRAFCVQTNEPPEFWLVSEVAREIQKEREKWQDDKSGRKLVSR